MVVDRRAGWVEEGLVMVVVMVVVVVAWEARGCGVRLCRVSVGEGPGERSRLRNESEMRPDELPRPKTDQRRRGSKTETGEGRAAPEKAAGGRGSDKCGVREGGGERGRGTRQPSVAVAPSGMTRLALTNGPPNPTPMHMYVHMYVCVCLCMYLEYYGGTGTGTCTGASTS